MIRAARQLTPWAAGLLAALTGGAAFGQGNIFNPYGNSGYADYREFGSPKYATDASLPGEARLQSVPAAGRGANQFEAYLNSLENGDLNAGRGSAGLPYYRAQQLYNAQTAGGGRLNDSPANRLYQARVAERNAAYQAALAEKDPKKRAVMFQRLDRDAIERPLSAIPSQVAGTRKSGQPVARYRGDSVARSPENSSPVARSAAPRLQLRPATRPSAPARSATPPAASIPAQPAVITPAPAASTPTPDTVTPSQAPNPSTAAPTTEPTPPPVDPSSVPVPAPR